MTREEKIVIQIECQNLLNHVGKLIDTQFWEELALCYTKNATLFRPSDPKNALIGREDILSSFTQRPPKTTCHILSNFVFDILSDTSVRVNSRVILFSSTDIKNIPALTDSKIMIGSFDDILCLIDEKWYIESRKGGIELKY